MTTCFQHCISPFWMVGLCSHTSILRPTSHTGGPDHCTIFFSRSSISQPCFCSAAFSPPPAAQACAMWRWHRSVVACGCSSTAGMSAQQQARCERALLTCQQRHSSRGERSPPVRSCGVQTCWGGPGRMADEESSLSMTSHSVVSRRWCSQQAGVQAVSAGAVRSRPEERTRRGCSRSSCASCRGLHASLQQRHAAGEAFSQPQAHARQPVAPATAHCSTSRVAARAAG